MITSNNKCALYNLLIITILCGQPLLVNGQSILTGPEAFTHQQTIIKSKFNFYNDTFKDIQFMHMDGGIGWQDKLNSILNLLKNNAVALDYEHPQDLRQDLIYVSIERLKYMVKNDEISSTLFRVNNKKIIPRGNLCIISLNPEIIGTDDIGSIRYMLDYSDKLINKIHPSKYIDAQNFIKYSVDHEIFHCLNSFLYGGAPMTHELMGGEYNQIIRESAADAFALSMHLKKKEKVTSFARNIVHIRALSIFNNAPEHNTFNTVSKVLKFDINQLKKMNVMEIISLSMRLASETVGTYHEFINQQALELRAEKDLSLENSRSKESLKELVNIIPEQSKVKRMVNNSRYYYKQLFTDTVIDLEAEPLH